MSARRSIELRSDNTAGVAPEILSAIATANHGSALAYGGDEWTERLRQLVRRVFEAPEAEVFPVVSGTAANALGLSALCPPWGAVLCHETAHILASECAATSLLAGGASLRGLPGPDYRLAPESLEEAFAATRWGDPHHSQPSALSLTCPTDYGTLYAPEEVAALARVAAARGLRVHLDGARLANALDALGCRPADLTWRAGVHVLSLGATKNGALSTDAIVSFDAAASAELRYRIKRAGHVASKLRFQSVQLEAYLSDDLWLRLARTANRAMQRLLDGMRRLQVEVLGTPRVNLAFARVPPAAAARLAQAGVLFYAIRPDVLRFVTSFATTEADVDEVLQRLEDALR